MAHWNQNLFHDKPEGLVLNKKPEFNSGLRDFMNYETGFRMFTFPTHHFSTVQKPE